MPPKFSRATGTDRSHARDYERATLLDLDNSDEDGAHIFTPQNADRLNGPSKANDNVARVKGEIKSVVNIMQNNISRVMDRGAKIDDLQDKSENLEMSAFQFRSGSKKLQRQMWWQNCRLKIIFAFVVIVILLIIIVPIVIKSKKKS